MQSVIELFELGRACVRPKYVIVYVEENIDRRE